MKKLFCDVCEKPLKRFENVANPAFRYEPTTLLTSKSGDTVRLSAEVIVAIEGETNGGELCLPCLLRLLTSEQAQ